MATVAKRPPRKLPNVKAKGRSLSDFGKLLAAENALRAACSAGETAIINKGKKPETLTNENKVRSSFIRFLVLGGDENAPVHERGVQIRGAWLHGDLDLMACKSNVPITILDSKIDGTINVMDASISTLHLDGTEIGLLRGDRLKTTGAIYLRRGFRALGEICLAAAVIGSEISCDDGEFLSKSGTAINLKRARLNGVLAFRNVKKTIGIVSLSGAEVGSLLDDIGSWSLSKCLILDGFRYGRIIDGPTDSESRISWLKMQISNHLNGDFKPQPWEQLIKVLREMGHEADARAVAIEKQRMLRAAGEITGILNPLHRLYGLLAGYGYKPLNAVCAMFLVWIFSGHIFDYAEQRGLMGPAAPAIQANKSINDACGGTSGTRETNWTRCKELPQEYTTFNPYLYSLDLILPPIDLQQDSDWAPIVVKDDGVTRIGLGVFFRSVMWFEILFGWAMTLLVVAVLGNLVKKD